MKTIRLTGTDGSRYFTFDLEPGKHIVGRQPECDIYLPNKTVSRQHAELEILDSGPSYLIDLGSHNGTALNGVKVVTRLAIKPGDSITFGQIEFRLSDDSDESGQRSTPTITRLGSVDPEKSVFLSINEALQPLPQRVADLPDLFPTLSEMARMLVLSEQKEIMLSRALELVAKVIPAERLAILFTTEDHKEIYTAATLLPSGKDPGEFTLSKTIANQILSEKQAMLVADTSREPRLAEQHSIVMSKLKSAMAVPLFDEGNVLGILYVDSTNPIHRYSDDYLRLLATFGNIIASRLANYSLLQEREEMKIIEAELDRASGIQKQLLLLDSPSFDNYDIHAFQEQCRAVGGDLYDVATLADGRVLFLVADVSGKGLGAALLMSNILASFRILYSQPEFNLMKVVQEVSRQLFRFSTPGDFATLFVGIIDPARHVVNYVNAGHNPAYIVRSSGSIETMEASGTMIGAFDDMSWSEDEISLDSGDMLCVYTDGVTEAEQKNSDQYGEERLQERLNASKKLAAKEVAEKINNDIAVFVEDAQQSDDVTILIIKRVS